MKNRKKDAGWKRIITGCLIGAGLSVMLCFTGAGLTSNEMLPETAMKGWCLGALILSAAGAAAASAEGNRKLLLAVLGAASLFILLTACKLLFFPGEGSGILKNAGCCLCSGLGIGLLKGRAKNRKRYPSRRR